ncbi:hypothetical protein [Agriterribacter sp.]|uniref:hypothetical protein n=1 Tax=Agriterribacter sp. TaxID=2821509 RepID=UPI002BCDCE62|nr:hypothetical protein [Agriterribacter sp.]HTN06200.1 hypothetical protein [Agriterribacter sp.]
MKSVLLLWIATCCMVMCANSQLQVIAHYNMGKSGNISFVLTPDSLKDLSGNGNHLKRAGSPLFFADAPEYYRLKGDGSILFKKDASYHIEEGRVKHLQRFVLELTIRAEGAQDNQGDEDNIKSVLVYGDKNSGYSIVRKGTDLNLTVDGGTSYYIGSLLKEAWMHVALVSEGNDKVAIYVNGKKLKRVKASQKTLREFVVGSAYEMKAFDGLVYEVRLSELTGKLNIEKDMLYTQKGKTPMPAGLNTDIAGILNSIATNKAVVPVTRLPAYSNKKDWLISKINHPVKIYLERADGSSSGKLLVTNGLISREFFIGDNLVCVSLKNLYNDAEYLRAIKPEARIMIDSIWYNIGGLYGQPEKAYLLNNWHPTLKGGTNDYRFSGIEVKTPEERYPWTQKYNAAKADWPAKGLHIVMHYEAPFRANDTVKKIQVAVHYEMYEGAPVMAKWFTVQNESGGEVVINKMECEVLAINPDQKERISVESDYSFNNVNATPEASGPTLYPVKDNDNPARFGSSTTQWKVDQEYDTWATQNTYEDILLGNIHYSLLLSTLSFGPEAVVKDKTTFQSFTSFELLHDSDDKERQSLAHRKFYRKLAPQVTESLLTAGITSNNADVLNGFIDQMGEFGFERLDVMAWPGISHDNLDPSYLGIWKSVTAHAKNKNIIVGGYELQVASRGRGAAYDCIDPATHKPGSFFGQSVCIASKWQDIYYPKMWKFIDSTGIMSVNVDGPYHGDVCASLSHPYHRNYYDSQWEQWKYQVKTIHEFQRRHMYVPMPDWYFLNGATTTGMGYREASANLTPQQQLLLGRQYIYDGTWYKTPTMGWMTLQLVGFYSGDPAIGLEPLAKNIDRYEAALFQYLASGCQLTIRGNRLYDGPETKAMLQKWISWYKKHRAILTADIIHIARPTGRGLDALLHVDPELDTKGMLIVFNPTDENIKKKLTIPLYYTGLNTVAHISEREGEFKEYALNYKGEIEIEVDVKEGGFTWLVIK